MCEKSFDYLVDERATGIISSFLINEMHVTDTDSLIRHATVTFVCKSSASLYCRHSSDLIFAPASAFPVPPGVKKKDRDNVDLRDFVSVGRSVIFRAEPSSKIPNFMVIIVEVSSFVDVYLNSVAFPCF
ncbi:unnamed protein product [Soboliphyme baturini]|uniref:Vesicle-fusing ATPase n=1 Tax=Soboliphyme baturini TaxID=241478 RepID=A0A183JB74_9BILA|nr:unnamed protein product [Soboliphyme baturini]